MKVSQRKGAFQNQAHKRADILQVAAAHFGVDGYAGTDVQVIADELGVGKATIYRQFETKEDLFIACLECGLARLNEELLKHVGMRATEMPIQQKVEAGFFDFLEFFDRHPELIEILIQARSLFPERALAVCRKHWEYNSSTWMGRLQTAIDDGLIRSAYPEYLVDVFNIVLYGSLFTRRFGQRSVSTELIAKAMADLFVNGLAGGSVQGHD